MLAIDLLETEAGKQVFEEGQLQAIRQTICQILNKRFTINLSDEIRKKLDQIDTKNDLNHLIDKALTCKDLVNFNNRLAELLFRPKDKKGQKKPVIKKRGTDEAFLGLMKICGHSVLKLLGFSHEEAIQYKFRAIVLKEKRLEPDIEAIPILEGSANSVYIEFQGYNDPFIRYRSVANALIGSVQNNYKGQVTIVIFFTEETFKKAALEIKAFPAPISLQLSQHIKEIVLTRYTTDQLVEIDPKLIILAPFTISSGTSKNDLVVLGRAWKTKIKQSYPISELNDALNVIGLFLLSRFRNLTREEIVSMFKFDLLDTVAGQQIYEEGKKAAWNEASETYRKQIIDSLKKLGETPEYIHEIINSVFSQQGLMPVK